MYYDAIDLLKGMISRPSFSREEGETADFLKQSWEKAGYKVNRKGNNLWLIAPGFDLDKPTLLLNSHIDTVKPASGWTKDPFNPEETEDERLYGLGSNDAGASVVSLYEAFRVLSGKEQPYNLIFLASCEEEVSGKNGLESALADLPPIAFAVVGEPTGMQPAVAEKGLMVLDCVSTGKAGHAARNEGINAITLAMKDIEWFNTYQFPGKSDFLGPVKMSVTIIHAGTQHNVVPDRCEFTVDIRTFQQLVDFLGKCQPDFVVHVLRTDSHNLLACHVGDVLYFGHCIKQCADSNLSCCVAGSGGGASCTRNSSSGGKDMNIRFCGKSHCNGT